MTRYDRVTNWQHASRYFIVLEELGIWSYFRDPDTSVNILHKLGDYDGRP